jgi:preprotein translocase subunit SecF
MELFKNTNYDFLGKKWPFIIASLVLTVAGFGSIALKGGLKYGIDFKEGTLIQVKFANPPQDNKIRSAMLQKIKTEVSVQDLSGNGVVNTVEIGTEAKGQGESQLNTNQNTMRAVLTDTFGQPGSGKLDLNNTSEEELTNRLRDPLARAGVALNEDQLKTLIRNILGEMNTQHSGLIVDFSQLSSVAGVLFGAIPRGIGTDGGPQSGSEVAREGGSRHFVRFGRHAGLHCIPVRMDLRFGRGDRVLPRHAHHYRTVFVVR